MNSTCIVSFCTNTTAFVEYIVIFLPVLKKKRVSLMLKETLLSILQRYAFCLFSYLN